MRKGFGQCRQRDSVIWCLDAPSVETYVEPLYPAGLDVSGQVRFNRGLGRKRRSRSEPRRRFSTTYGDMVAPPKLCDAPAGQAAALPPPPPPARPPRPPRRRSRARAPPADRGGARALLTSAPFSPFPPDLTEFSGSLTGRLAWPAT